MVCACGAHVTCVCVCVSHASYKLRAGSTQFIRKKDTTIFAIWEDRARTYCTGARAASVAHDAQRAARRHRKPTRQ